MKVITSEKKPIKLSLENIRKAVKIALDSSKSTIYVQDYISKIKDSININ